MQEILLKDISHLAAEKMLFEFFSYLGLWQPLCSIEQNHLCVFGRRHHEEYFCKLEFGPVAQGKCHLKTFVIWSSGSPFV